MLWHVNFHFLLFSACFFKLNSPHLVDSTQHPLGATSSGAGQIGRVVTLQCGCGRWWPSGNCGDLLFHQWENYKFKECWHITLLLKSWNLGKMMGSYGSSSIMEGFAQNSSGRRLWFTNTVDSRSWFDHPPLKFVWFDCSFCVGVFEDDSPILVQSTGMRAETWLLFFHHFVLKKLWDVWVTWSVYIMSSGSNVGTALSEVWLSSRIRMA